ncbi:MAG: TetR/AcrR family transcriptional regulator [Ktedonobacterales bacterium]
MPYSKAHKAQTRAKIVEAATHAFREEGIGGVGIPAVMRQAGLTHGGFYAHFESKDDLVAAACDAGYAESVARLRRRAARLAHDDVVPSLMKSYLSPAHRDSPASGCTIAALAGDITRAPADVRAAFTRGLADYAQELGTYLPASAGDTADHKTDEALVLLAGMAGALLLARAVDDPHMSERILDAAHDFYARSLGEQSGHESARADLRKL